MRNFFLTLIALTLFLPVASAQEGVVNDSIAPVKNDSLRTLMQPDNLQGQTIQNDFHISEPEMNTPSFQDRLEDSNFGWEPRYSMRYSLPRSTYYEDEFIRVNPFNYSFDNGFQGGWMGGINNHMPFSERFKVNVNLYASSSFYGPFYPERYNNATLSFDMRYQLHERVRLVGFGEVSLREGMDPVLSPTINGGYNFGGGVEFKITKNIGFGIGIVNSYYRNRWTTTPYAGPVGW